jgi:hypothetical protein
LLVAGAGAATFAITPAASAPAPTIDLRGDADAIASTFDRAANTAQMRASGIAAMPMLRAGIETDAATLQDMVANEMLLAPGAGEAMELFQLQGAAQTSVLRLPAGTPAIATPVHDTRVERADKTLRVVATAPIKTQKGADGGTLAVAIAIDLKSIESGLATRTRGARIIGLSEPVELVPRGDATATVSAPIEAKAVHGLTLEANITATVAPARTPPWLAPVRYASFALAGLLLLIYLVRSLNRRDE